MALSENTTTLTPPTDSITPGSDDYETDPFETPIPFPLSKRYLGDGFTYTMATVNLCLGLQALLLNIFVVSFYFKKRRDTVPLMYLFVSSTDLLTALSALLVSLIFFLQKNFTEASIALVLPAYAIFSITFKVSVFLNLTVAVARTINIIQPFYRIKNKAFVIAATVYILGWTVFTVVQIATEDEENRNSYSIFDAYLYSPGQFQVAYTSTTTRVDECRNVLLFIGLPYLLPSIVVVFCMAVQSYTLLKLQPEKTNNTDVQKNITTTIFMMTVLFFICNTVYVVYPILQCRNVFQERDTEDEQHKEMLGMFSKMRFLTGVVAPFVNAAFNPLILIARGTALKAAIRKSSKMTVSFAMTRPSRTSGTVFLNMNSITDTDGGGHVPNYKRDSRLELSVNGPRNSRVETSFNNRGLRRSTPPVLNKKESKVTFSSNA